MNPATLMPLLVGVAIGVALLPLLWRLALSLFVQVDHEECVMITQLGQLACTLDRPGLHFLPSRVVPGLSTTEHRVSLQRDFREVKNVHINDACGTTMIVDLWLEFRIVDPQKALFEVEDWDRSLQNLITHAAISILGRREFHQILCDRSELGELLQREIAHETARWGLSVDLAFIHNVSLLPEVSRQMFEAIAARLERTKADIEEEGRLRVAQLEATTSVAVAGLVAQAKGQYPAAIGRAFTEIGQIPAVLEAYNELYALSQVRPNRTVAFQGFGDGELSATEAGMMMSQPSDAHQPTERAPLPLLPGKLAAAHAENAQ